MGSMSRFRPYNVFVKLAAPAWRGMSPVGKLSHVLALVASLGGLLLIPLWGVNGALFFAASALCYKDVAAIP